METTKSSFGQSNVAEGVMDDSMVASRLVQKNFSPMIVRRTSVKNWPVFVGLICDYSLEDLDVLIHNIIDEADNMNMLINNIQSLRNFIGYMNERITNHYNDKKRGCAEGVIVTGIFDKFFAQSAGGDFMNHTKCLQEYMFLLNMAPHI